jgi:predicted Fe-Mo cluster-binding NifX family protein
MLITNHFLIRRVKMIIAVSSKGPSIENDIDERFGRTPCFIVYDLEKDTYQSIDNTQVFNAPQGAGIQAAQHVVDSGAEAVLTGHVGPKAFQVLQAAGIKVFLARGMQVKDAINCFREDKLPCSESNDVEDHWV